MCRTLCRRRIIIKQFGKFLPRGYSYLWGNYMGYNFNIKIYLHSKPQDVVRRAFTFLS